MGQFVVEGGGRLAGTFRINGSKNAALPILAACILAEEPVTLCNVPTGIRDVVLMLEILTALGVAVEVSTPDTVKVDATALPIGNIPEDLMRRMRASLFLVGPLLGRTGQAEVSRPGGCDIGLRPIDLHLKGLGQLGVHFTEKPGGRVAAEARKMVGSHIFLDFPSVGATENIMMAAVRAEGDTVIDNAAREPEIVDLAMFLNKLGARIRGAGTDTIRITGVSKLLGTCHHIIPDRIEAGTVAVASVMTGGRVTLEECVPDHLLPLWRKLTDMGASVDYVPGSSRVTVGASDMLRATSLRTGPHPGFPTDLQPLLLALMTRAQGVSTVVETVFENRLRHALELKRMGACLLTDGRMAVVYGSSKLSGATVETTDLRAGAALLVAGLSADGETRINGSEIIERGYQDFPRRLSELGAKVERV